MKRSFAVILIAFVVFAAHSLAAGQTGSPVLLTPNQKTVWQGVYTAEQAKRGADAYRQYCSRCHGNALEGVTASKGPALAGNLFFDHWNGLSIFDVTFKIQNSMPHQEEVLVSPGTVTFLPANTIRDIVSFVLQTNKVPAGATPLPEGIDALRQILITKPNRP